MQIIQTVVSSKYLSIFINWSVSEVPQNNGLSRYNSPNIQPIDQISTGVA